MDLKAQINADEQLAHNAGGGEWKTLCTHGDDCPDYPSCSEIEGKDIKIYPEGGHSAWQADHITRHDPARVLREVAAKRAILAEFERDPQADDQYLAGLAFALERLAEVYGN